MKLIVFSGLPGTGKSRLAEAVGRARGIPVFAKDWLEATLIKSELIPSRADCESMDGITTMNKPSMNILRRNRQQSLFERLDQIGKGSGFEAAQNHFDLR